MANLVICRQSSHLRDVIPPHLPSERAWWSTAFFANFTSLVVTSLSYPSRPSTFLVTLVNHSQLQLLFAIYHSRYILTFLGWDAALHGLNVSSCGLDTGSQCPTKFFAGAFLRLYLPAQKNWQTTFIWVIVLIGVSVNFSIVVIM